jgi:hypothetical protein
MPDSIEKRSQFPNRNGQNGERIDVDADGQMKSSRTEN